MGLAACATVRVVHEHRDTSATPSHDAGTVVVQQGDTLYAIASLHGVKVGDLAAWNELTAPYTIKPGQRLQMMPTVAGMVTTTTTTMPASDGPVVKSEPLEAQAPVAVAPPKSASPAAKPGGSAPPTAKAGNAAGQWQWPADGTLLARAKSAALGIDIAGDAGAPIRAVTDGVVLYSGTGSPGYEELIVIRHDGDWVSSYAHNRKRLIGEGQRVKAGDRIAEMGRTGTSRDQLHFEMRHNGDLVDPLMHLPKR